MPGALKGRAGRSGGREELEYKPKGPRLLGLPALRSQTQRGGRRRQVGGEMRRRAGTQAPDRLQQDGPAAQREKGRRAHDRVLKRRNWDFCFGSRTGLRAHTMPSVETPCLEGRTVAHLGKVRVRP